MVPGLRIVDLKNDPTMTGTVAMEPGRYNHEEEYKIWYTNICPLGIQIIPVIEKGKHQGKTEKRTHQKHPVMASKT